MSTAVSGEKSRGTRGADSGAGIGAAPLMRVIIQKNV
jgi:hypothetical protein